MSQQEYERVFKLLSPALKRIVKDDAFRQQLERAPLEALAEMNLQLSADIAAELEGKTFSEFWAAHRAKVEGPGALRDLPPQQELSDAELGAVVAGADQTAQLNEQRQISSFAPPYVPVGPVVSGAEYDPKVSELNNLKDSKS